MPTVEGPFNLTSMTTTGTDDFTVKHSEWPHVRIGHIHRYMTNIPRFVQIC